MARHLQHPIGSTARIRLRDGSEPGRVPVVSSRGCGHVETMCGQCTDQWVTDWIISAYAPATDNQPLEAASA